MSVLISNSPQPLPRRFRERSFRVFERALAAVISAYPSVISINPILSYNLSQETFAARFRDAKHSYFEHNWPSKYIDREKFILCHTNISVSMPKTNSLVRIGDKDELKNPPLEIEHSIHCAASLTPVDSLIVLSGSDLELDLICKLAALRLLTQEVKCTGFDEQSKHKYEQKYDVSIEINPGTGIASIL